MIMHDLVDYYLIFFFLLFGALWVLIFYLFARVGGWGRLAKQYREVEKTEGEKFRFQNAMLNYARYRSGVTFVVNRRGLGLSMPIFMRMGHPPLFIPWNEITVKDVEKKFFGQCYEITASRCPDVSLKIETHLARRISKLSGITWPGLTPKEPVQDWQAKGGRLIFWFILFIGIYLLLEYLSKK